MEPEKVSPLKLLQGNSSISKPSPQKRSGTGGGGDDMSTRVSVLEREVMSITRKLDSLTISSKEDRKSIEGKIETTNERISTLSNKVIGAFIAGILAVVIAYWQVIQWNDSKLALQTTSINQISIDMNKNFDSLDKSISLELQKLKDGNKNEKP